MVKNVGCLVMLFLSALLAPASPAPAPTLLSPPSGASNVDPDSALSWRWVDELMVNGSFESGLTPGWYLGGANPSVWKIFPSTTNACGMGYKRAGTDFLFQPAYASAQLIQDL